MTRNFSITTTLGKRKGKGLDTCYSAAYLSLRLATSSALQCQKWQLIGMSRFLCAIVGGSYLTTVDVEMQAAGDGKDGQRCAILDNILSTASFWLRGNRLLALDLSE